MEFEKIILSFGFLASFLIMTFAGFTGLLSKPFYLTAGYLSQQGRISFLSIVIAGTLGHSFGNYLQFILSKKNGLKWLSKSGFLVEAQISKFTKTFNKKPIFWLFLGKITEPVKSFISICAGISKIKTRIFLPIILFGSLIWAFVFTSFGFYLGKNFESSSIFGIAFIILGLLLIFYFQKEIGKTEKKL